MPAAFESLMAGPFDVAVAELVEVRRLRVQKFKVSRSKFKI